MYVELNRNPYAASPSLCMCCPTLDPDQEQKPVKLGFIQIKPSFHTVLFAPPPKKKKCRRIFLYTGPQHPKQKRPSFLDVRYGTVWIRNG